MANKLVSIFIGSTDDHVNRIGPTNYDMSIADLVANNPAFSLVLNPNGQTDLGFEIDEAQPAVEGEFVEASTSNIYHLQTEDYVGDRPKSRCPNCPSS